MDGDQKRMTQRLGTAHYSSLTISHRLRAVPGGKVEALGDEIVDLD
jgi:hypothetical protein